MQLKELIETLMVGQLSQSSLAKFIIPKLTDLNDVEGTAQAQYAQSLGKVIRAINLGLTNIYTQLDLAKEEIFLDTNPGMDRYLLDIDHAVYAGRDSSKTKWIIDSEYSPFRGNIIECLSVADEFGASMYTNDSAATWNVNFPSPNIIQVPFAENDVTLSIIYKANHPKIPFSLTKSLPITGTEILGYTTPDMEIELPEFLHNALTCFVAHKYFQSLGSAETSAQSQTNYVEYINAVNDAKPFIHGNYTQIDNLANEGWV